VKPSSHVLKEPLATFTPLWGPLVLRLKGDVGAVISGKAQGVPIFERYFVGGIYDVRVSGWPRWAAIKVPWRSFPMGPCAPSRWAETCRWCKADGRNALVRESSTSAPWVCHRTWVATGTTWRSSICAE